MHIRLEIITWCEWSFSRVMLGATGIDIHGCKYPPHFREFRRERLPELIQESKEVASWEDL